VDAVTAAVLISAGGLVVNLFVSLFIAGSRWGQVRTELTALRDAQATNATKGDLSSVSERIARIEGMFELRLREGQVKLP